MKDKINNTKCYESKIMLIRPYILKFCKSRIFDHQEAEDVCQKTIYILLDKKKTYTKSKSFYAWAFRIARFQIMGYMTRKKRKQDPIDHASPIFDQDLNVSEDSILHSIQVVEDYMPFTDILKKELTQEREKQFKLLEEKLAPKEKTFFKLSFQGKSKEHIRAELEITDNGYSRLKGRVINKMKKNLDIKKIETYKIKEWEWKI